MCGGGRQRARSLERWKRTRREKLVEKKGALSPRDVDTWPPKLLKWLDALSSDSDYPVILAARNPLTHARLIRHLTTVDKSIRVDINRTRYTTDDLIILSQNLANRQVEAFLEVVAVM